MNSNFNLFLKAGKKSVFWWILATIFSLTAYYAGEVKMERGMVESGCAAFLCYGIAAFVWIKEMFRLERIAFIQGLEGHIEALKTLLHANALSLQQADVLDALSVARQRILAGGDFESERENISHCLLYADFLTTKFNKDIDLRVKEMLEEAKKSK